MHEVVIIEAGEDYVREVDRLDAVATLEEAKQAARDAGYTVIDHGEGGCCETNDTWEPPAGQFNGHPETYHLITVLPKNDSEPILSDPDMDRGPSPR